MRLLSSSLLAGILLALLSECALCAPTGSVAIGGEFQAVSLGWSGSVNSAPFGSALTGSEAAPRALIALQLWSDADISLDIKTGFRYSSSVEIQTEMGNYRLIGERMLAVEAGPNILLLKSERAQLRLPVSVAVMIWRAYASTTIVEFTPTGGSTTMSAFDTYTEMTYYGQIGLEPSYFLSDHLALYSSAGIGIMRSPSTKEIDTASPDFKWDADNPPLKSMDDSRISIGITGVAIGVRYYF